MKLAVVRLMLLLIRRHDCYYDSKQGRKRLHFVKVMGNRVREAVALAEVLWDWSLSRLLHREDANKIKLETIVLRIPMKIYPS